MSEANGVARREWDHVDGVEVEGLDVLGTRRGRIGARKGRKPAAKRGKVKPRGLSGRRKLALVVGGIGTGLLGLSVTHCTEAIGLLTGSHWALAGLMAVGIDAGMVGAECSEVAGKGSYVAHWSRGYVGVSIGLSMLLNAYAFGLHASPGMTWAAWVLGATVPGLVYALASIATGLWTAE